jgi:hypothetical protein
MKYYLVLYLCSIISGECPTSTYTPMSFNNHYDCVVNGYRVAHNTFKNLEETEEFERERIEREKLVVKFECKQFGEKT